MQTYFENYTDKYDCNVILLFDSHILCAIQYAVPSKLSIIPRKALECSRLLSSL